MNRRDSAARVPNLADVADRLGSLEPSRRAIPLLYLEFSKNHLPALDERHDAQHKKLIAAAFKHSLGTILRKGDLVAAGPGAYWFVALLVARARRARSEISDADLGLAAERIRRAAQVALGSSRAPKVRCGWSVLELDGASPLVALRQAVRGAAVVARVEHQRATTLAAITHELRTPLTAIIGFAERLKVGELDSERRSRAVDIIIDEARRLSRLAEGLIDIAAWSAGYLRLQRTQVDLLGLIRQAGDALKERAQSKNVRIQLRGRAPPLEIDRDRCLQVFLNVLDNAVRHSPRGSTVKVHVCESKAQCVIQVADRGRGFSADVRRILGQPFARGQDGNVGLGLAVSKVIVEAHGGKLRVSSRGGGRVTVSLPAARPLRRSEQVFVSNN